MTQLANEEKAHYNHLMKNILLLNLLFVTSCALYDSYQNTNFNWLGSPKHRVAKEVPREDIVSSEEVRTPSTPFEEMISKNWEYTKRKDPLSGSVTYEATTLSAEKDVSLTILKNDQNKVAVIIGLNTEEVSYREGHSITALIDGERLLQTVAPSEGKSAKEVRLKNSEEFAQLLSDKKELSVELNLNGKGTRNYGFDVSGLQKFFTIN